MVDERVGSSANNFSAEESMNFYITEDEGDELLEDRCTPREEKPVLETKEAPMDPRDLQYVEEIKKSRSPERRTHTPVAETSGCEKY